MYRVYLGSRNKHKARELNEIIHNSELEILPFPDDIQCNPEETGLSYYVNATIKAVEYSLALPNEFVIADDSGIEIAALDGWPGVGSARVAPEGNSANLLVLEKMQDTPAELRAAAYHCVIALARNGNIIATSYGKVEGQITFEQRGNQGFGYDPIFFYPPFNCTFGEVAADKKHAVSHRANALRGLFPNNRLDILR